MSNFILYLDESETHLNGSNMYFCIGGVIIDRSIERTLEVDLNTLKKSLWPSDVDAVNHILHEKEISEAQHNGRATHTYNNVFKQRAMRRQLYSGLSKILTQHHVTTLGACVNMSELNRCYPGESNPKLTIALQLLLENYCHFLVTHNSVGDICYESLQEPGNQGLRQRFYELEALGTMYYTPRAFQTHIGDIAFIEKSANVVGLQLADFIPNTYARKCASLEPKHKGFTSTILKLAYDGNIANACKYGMKKIP